MPILRVVLDYNSPRVTHLNLLKYLRDAPGEFSLCFDGKKTSLPFLA
jgi:hypothetical protein